MTNITNWEQQGHIYMAKYAYELYMYNLKDS